jgi:hypothetical protein
MPTLTTTEPPADVADDLTALAHRRLADVVAADSAVTTTLDALVVWLLDPDYRKLFTYSAFGSAL